MEPYRLPEGQAEAAGDLLAAAFFPAAVAAFLFPDPARRARLLPPFFAAMTRLAIRRGEAAALGAPPLAVALWLTPDGGEPTGADQAAAGMDAALAALDAGEAARPGDLNRHVDAAHGRVMDRPHWYLPFLGVAPGHQGRGTGSRLMRHALDRADAAGAPCYLESTDERTLPFYGRLGFRVAEEGTVPGSRIRAWALRRG